MTALARRLGSGGVYGLDDLRALEEACLAEAAAIGLRPPPVAFHLVPSEVVYDVAARGLPGRYAHWRFGQVYEQLKHDYDSGRSRIYELVVNTRPAHAYLLEGNSLVAQLLVIAHVLGHAVVFEESPYFAPADKGFLPRVRAAAARIDGYMSRYGQTVVEDFIDDCEALATTFPLAQLGGRYDPDEPEDVPRPYDELFPEEVEARRAAVEAERESARHRFPRHPERDILAFMMRHARTLDDWQRDILGIVREEQRYFAPQLGTKLVHEGMATWTHNTIVQRLRLDSAGFVEFMTLNAAVTQPHPLRVNPYSVGWAIFREIERIAADPSEDERDRWWWAGCGEPVERILEVVRGYDDAALVSEFVTPRVCEECRLYAWEQPEGGRMRVRISSREADEIRAALVRSTVNGGLPVLQVVDADGGGHGELVLEHVAEDVGLDVEYAEGTLRHLRSIWGKPVAVISVSPSGKRVRHRVAGDPPLFATEHL